MGIGERLRGVRNDLGETQKSMSKRLGLGESTWQGYELRDKAPSGEVLEALIAEGFDANWILTGQGRIRLSGPGDVGLAENSMMAYADGVGLNYIPIKLLADRPGGSGFSDLAFRAAWLRALGIGSATLRVLPMTDDSMVPDIARGDLLLVDVSLQTLDSPGLYLIDRDDKYQLRDCSMSPSGKVFLTASSHEFEREVLSLEEAADLFIVGKVRSVVKRV